MLRFPEPPAGYVSSIQTICDPCRIRTRCRVPGCVERRIKSRIAFHPTTCRLIEHARPAGTGDLATGGPAFSSHCHTDTNSSFDLLPQSARGVIFLNASRPTSFIPCGCTLCQRRWRRRCSRRSGRRNHQRRRGRRWNRRLCHNWWGSRRNANWRRRSNRWRWSHFLWLRWLLGFLFGGFGLINVNRGNSLNNLFNSRNGQARNKQVPDQNMDQRHYDNGNNSVSTHLLVSVGHPAAFSPSQSSNVCSTQLSHQGRIQTPAIRGATELDPGRESQNLDLPVEALFPR